MKNESPLVDKHCVLERFPGKGGWTYARVPEIPQNKKTPFGWVTVKGSIDHYEFKSYKLMPMGNGELFFPVKAQVRKRIGKEAGDEVRIILFKDDAPIEIPEELALCLRDEPGAYETFIRLKEGEKKAFIDWIAAAKTEDTKVSRMAATITKIVAGEKMPIQKNKQA